MLQCNGCNGSVCVRKLKNNEPLLIYYKQTRSRIIQNAALNLSRGETTVDEREKELSTINISIIYRKIAKLPDLREFTAIKKGVSAFFVVWQDIRVPPFQNYCQICESEVEIGLGKSTTYSHIELRSQNREHKSFVFNDNIFQLLIRILAVLMNDLLQPCLPHRNSMGELFKKKIGNIRVVVTDCYNAAT